MATIMLEDGSVEIKKVRKLDEYEWYGQIETCTVICSDPFTTHCYFWLTGEIEGYIKLFCGNIKWSLRDLDPSRIWIVETEWKWEGKPGSRKDRSIRMVFYEDPDTPIRVPEDIVEILRETPVDQWYNPSI